MVGCINLFCTRGEDKCPVFIHTRLVDVTLAWLQRVQLAGPSRPVVRRVLRLRLQLVSRLSKAGERVRRAHALVQRVRYPVRTTADRRGMIGRIDGHALKRDDAALRNRYLVHLRQVQRRQPSRPSLSRRVVLDVVVLVLDRDLALRHGLNQRRLQGVQRDLHFDRSPVRSCRQR